MGADVNVILSFSSTTQISLGATGVRTLYGVASGAIRLAADGYGKSPAGGGAAFSYSIGAGDITGGTMYNFGSYWQFIVGTNSTVVRDALIATTAGNIITVGGGSMFPNPSSWTASSQGGLVAGDNGPTAVGLYGAFIYVTNTNSVMASNGGGINTISRS